MLTFTFSFIESHISCYFFIGLTSLQIMQREKTWGGWQFNAVCKTHVW